MWVVAVVIMAVVIMAVAIACRRRRRNGQRCQGRGDFFLLRHQLAELGLERQLNLQNLIITEAFQGRASRVVVVVVAVIVVMPVVVVVVVVAVIVVVAVGVVVTVGVTRNLHHRGRPIMEADIQFTHPRFQTSQIHRARGVAGRHHRFDGRFEPGERRRNRIVKGR